MAVSFSFISFCDDLPGIHLCRRVFSHFYFSNRELRIFDAEEERSDSESLNLLSPSKRTIPRQRCGVIVKFKSEGTIVFLREGEEKNKTVWRERKKKENEAKVCRNICGDSNGGKWENIVCQIVVYLVCHVRVAKRVFDNIYRNVLCFFPFSSRHAGNLNVRRKNTCT